MSIDDEQKLTQRQRYWLEHLRACEVAGKSMRAYAGESGIGVRALYDAKKRLVKRGVLAAKQGRSGVGFVRAQVVGSVVHGEACRVQFPNGITVTFSAALEGEGLSRLLRTVATLG